MKPTIKILCALALLQATGFCALATSDYINYQGLLNGADGNPLPTGAYIMEFNIYDQASLGNRVWGPFRFDGSPGDGHGPLVPVANGRFNVVIGPLDTSSMAIRDVFDGNNRYIEVRVSDGSPILPRQQFLSNPYAFRSSTAASLAAIGTPTPAVTAEGTNISISGAVSVGTTLNVAGNATLSGDLFVNSGQVSSLQAVAGLVIADTIYATNAFTTMMQATSIVASNITAQGAVNGEQPPYIIKMGTPGNTTDYHTNQVPSEIVQVYLGDGDGGVLRYILRINDTDEVRTIVEFMAIEQPDESEDRTAGLNGFTFESGGGTVSFILNNGVRYDLAPHPWDWIYLRNWSDRGLQGLPGTDSPAFPAFENGEPNYTIEFLTVPRVSATIIIYDR